VRQPLRQDGTQVALKFAPLLGDKPLEVAQPVATAGGQLTPLNLRFYVSELSLIQGDGSNIAVDLLTASGAVVPFGIQLVNFDDPESTSIHFRAPAGTYTGARFTLGMNDACNAGSSGRVAPLSVNSEMVWPHFAGYLFLRYEAQWTTSAPSSTTAPPTVIHMGGIVGSVFAPQASISGTLTVPATGTLARTVQMSFEEIFRGATSSEEVTNVLPAPEVIAGERLRRVVPTAAIFQLSEP
jgi:hypothetical protein